MVSNVKSSNLPWYAQIIPSSVNTDVAKPELPHPLDFPATRPLDNLDLKIRTSLNLGEALSKHIQSGANGKSNNPMDIFSSIEDFQPHISIGFYEGIYSKHHANLNLSLLFALKMADFRITHYSEDVPRKAYLGALLFHRDREMFIHDFLIPSLYLLIENPEMNRPFAESVLYHLPDHIVENIFVNEVDYSGITALKNFSQSLKEIEKPDVIISGIEVAKNRLLITDEYHGRGKEVIEYLLKDLKSKPAATKDFSKLTRNDLLEQFYSADNETDQLKILDQLKIFTLTRRGFLPKDIANLYLAVAKNEVPGHDFSFQRRLDSLSHFAKNSDRELVVSELVKVAGGDDKFLVNTASTLLIRGDGKEAFKSLICREVLKDKSSQALATLAFLSSQSKSARDILISLLGSGDENVFQALAKLEDDVFCNVSCDGKFVRYYYPPERSISLSEMVDGIGLESVFTTSLFSVTAHENPIHLLSNLTSDFLIPRIASFIYRDENQAGLYLLDQVGLSAYGEPVKVLYDTEAELRLQMSKLSWWNDILRRKRKQIDAALESQKNVIRSGSVDFTPDNLPDTKVISKDFRMVSIIRKSFNAAHQIIDLADKFAETHPDLFRGSLLDVKPGVFTSEVEKVRQSFPPGVDFDAVLEHVFFRLPFVGPANIKRKCALAVLLIGQDRDAFIQRCLMPALMNDVQYPLLNQPFAVTLLKNLQDNDLISFIQNDINFKTHSELKELSKSLGQIDKPAVVINALLEKLRSCEEDLFSDVISLERLNIEVVINYMLNFKVCGQVVDNVYLLDDKTLMKIYKETLSRKTQELIAKQFKVKYCSDLAELKKIFYPLILDESEMSKTGYNNRKIALSYLLTALNNEEETVDVLFHLIQQCRDPVIQYDLCRELYSSSSYGDTIFQQIIVNDIRNGKPSYPFAFLCDLMTLTHNQDFISMFENVCKEPYPRGAFKQAFLNISKLELPGNVFLSDSEFYFDMSESSALDCSEFVKSLGIPYLLRMYNSSDRFVRENVRDLLSMENISHLPEQFAAVFSSGLDVEYTGPILDMGNLSQLGEKNDISNEVLATTPNRLPKMLQINGQDAWMWN